MRNWISTLSVMESKPGPASHDELAVWISALSARETKHGLCESWKKHSSDKEANFHDVHDHAHNVCYGKRWFVNLLSSTS